MRTDETSWDLKLAVTGKKAPAGHPIFAVHLPVPVSYALDERGFNRVKLALTKDGILLTPYAGKSESLPETVDLPF